MHTKPTGKSFGKDFGLVERPVEVGMDGALFAFDEDLGVDLDDGLDDRGQGRGKREKGEEKEKVCISRVLRESIGDDTDWKCLGAGGSKYG